MKPFFSVLALGCVGLAIAWAQPSGLPDASRTPGAVDPSVTQNNIHATVCVRGYTDTVRPDKKYTNRLKREQLKAYKYSDTDPRKYELDHLIPLNIGGDPKDPRNLWPQPREGEWSAEQKNELEWIAYQMVCRGELTLSAAQQQVATNWVQAYQTWVPPRRHWLPAKRRRED